MKQKTIYMHLEKERIAGICSQFWLHQAGVEVGPFPHTSVPVHVHVGIAAVLRYRLSLLLSHLLLIPNGHATAYF